MFECRVCGLLSLRGTSCPACGSEHRDDLSTTLDSEEILPTDVPGLDDAAESWYELEGIEPPKAEEGGEDSGDSSTLPFGFQGESNVYSSNLPFGIGSFAEGIPFDSTESGDDRIPLTSEPEKPQPGVAAEAVEVEQPAPAPSVPAEVEAATQSPAPAHPVAPEAPEVQEPVLSPAPVLPVAPEVQEPVPSPAPAVLPVHTPQEVPPHDLGTEVEPMLELPPMEVIAPVEKLPPPVLQDIAPSQPVRLVSARLVSPAPTTEEEGVPDYWKIDAEIPNYEEIYGNTDEVVEVSYDSLDDDVVVYDHSSDSPAAVFYSPLEATPAQVVKPSIQLDLHPIQALNVDVGGDQELASFLQEGFQAMQQQSWSKAARSFQKMASRLPSSPEVFNNYGIALLQRASSMKADDDSQQQQLAEAQFESAILALREAAKNAPTNGEILINLAHALIESGRSEKALGIMNVHNQRDKDSVKGLNTAAVAMFQLGQPAQAIATLKLAGSDEVVQRNLAQFSAQS